MDLASLRNIGLIAHIDAGKTTFSERILFYANVIHRMGEVHEGAATMDFLPEEQERGITISSACVPCQWRGYSINLVDTPGHVDFSIEVERCLRVLDAAVGIFCAVAGVEPQSETVWRQADNFGIPRLAVVNKMDRPGASFQGVLASLRERLGVRPVPLTLPLGEEEAFAGVLDLVRQERLLFDAASKGKIVTRAPFTPEEAALAAPWRESLLDALTEEDDALLELCLAGANPSPEQVDASLRKAVLARRLVPVFAASALKNIGIQPVLDAICRYLPSPLDLPPVLAREEGGGEVALPADPEAPVCALVFKVVMAGGRRLAFTRLYAGTLREGDGLTNIRQGVSERVARLYRLRAEQREQLATAVAGDIVALQGLKKVRSGDTLVGGGQRLLLEDIRSLRPVISLAFEPKNAEEGERLDDALADFCVEDPTLQVEMQESTGQRVVSGMGELHLEILRDRMRREYGIQPRVGNPQVVCRETLGAASVGAAVFDRELGGQPHYGKVSLRACPAPRGSGLSVHLDFEREKGGKALAAAVERGVLDACGSGPSGYPLEDVEVRVIAAEGNAGLVTPAGLHMAAQGALRQALERVGTLLLEPLMQVDITVPEPFLGQVIALLGMRGAKVDSLGERAGRKQISALAPLRGLFGFSTALRSASQGRAGLMMRFVRFDSL
ncbi:MAG: elongation factor G [Desulfovibrio sp.]|jgi:elongation factor G|nr:elongation factor G [Desulfovibrio sp.]